MPYLYFVEGTEAQPHYVVADNMGEAVETYKKEYDTDPIGLKKIADYVIISPYVTK